MNWFSFVCSMSVLGGCAPSDVACGVVDIFERRRGGEEGRKVDVREPVQGRPKWLLCRSIFLLFCFLLE
jgi:hypothetical protein